MSPTIRSNRRQDVPLCVVNVTIVFYASFIITTIIIIVEIILTHYILQYTVFLVKNK